MSDEKKQGDENWRDATADDVAEIIKTGKPIPARVRNEDVDSWRDDAFLQGWINGNWAARNAYWTHCQVYVEPAPTRIPKDGCRMLEDNEEPMPGDFINWGAGWNYLGEGFFPSLAVAAPAWYCRPIKEPVEEIGKNVGAEVIEAFSPVVVKPEPTSEKHREPTLADLRNGPIECEVRNYTSDIWISGLLVDIHDSVSNRFRAKNRSLEIERHWNQCRIEVPVETKPEPWKPAQGDQVRFVNPNHAKCGTIGRISCVLQSEYLFRSNYSNFSRWCAISELEKYEPEPKQHRTPTLADLASGAINCEVRQGSGDNWEKKLLIHIFQEYGFPFVTASQGSIHRWAHCRIEVPIAPCKSELPVPKGFRLLGDEPRLASDGYWSLSCKDWLVIGDRVEEASRDMWPAIRLVAAEPEPGKHFVVVTNQKGDQVFYVNGVLNRSSETSYDCFMAEVAKGRAVRIENYVAKKPVKEWPENLFDLVRKNNLVFEEREMIEPEPVKKLVIVNDQDNREALYVNGKLEDITHPIYGYNIAEAANGCKIRIESREVGNPDDDWPEKLSDLVVVDLEKDQTAMEISQQYRPFLNGQEAEPFFDTRLRRKSSTFSLYRIDAIHDTCCWIGEDSYTWEEAFEAFVKQDGTPFGMKLTENESQR